MLLSSNPELRIKCSELTADLLTKPITRISHRISTAAADPGMSTALRSVGFLDVLSSTPAESDRRAPCIHAHLRRLAAKPRAKCGLSPRQRGSWRSCLVNLEEAGEWLPGSLSTELKSCMFPLRPVTLPERAHYQRVAREKGVKPAPRGTAKPQPLRGTRQ